MERYKIVDIEERIGIGTPCNAPKKLEIKGEVFPVLVRPHGEGCECELSYEYSFGLGCPNPTNKLNINE